MSAQAVAATSGCQSRALDGCSDSHHDRTMAKHTKPHATAFHTGLIQPRTPAITNRYRELATRRKPVNGRSKYSAALAHRVRGTRRTATPMTIQRTVLLV